MKIGDPIYGSYVDINAVNEDIENNDIEIVNGVAYDTSRFNEETERRIIANRKKKGRPIPDDLDYYFSKRFGVR